MRFILWLTLLCSLSPIALWAQSNFSGILFNEANAPLVGAVVNWENTSIAAQSDPDGKFTIQRPDTSQTLILVIHYVGYPEARIEIYNTDTYLEIVVPGGNNTVDEVVVETEQRGNFTSTLNPLNVETISACELKRAACCSLAESFETNATVNVMYSDAVTGAREIEMLGLRGTYVQLMIENRPVYNRLGRAYGLEYIPGPWIEAIQISKGASTVRNGVQSIAGQINTELIKPTTGSPFFLNLYISHISMTSHRAELNTHVNWRINKKWSTGLLLHGNYIQGFTDVNKDAFLDVPNKRQINGMWRLFHTTKNWHVEWNVHGVLDGRSGGQMAKIYERVFDTTATHLYRIHNNTRRIDAFGKIGFLGFKNPSQSLALVYGANVHEQDGKFGNRRYDALQREGYANLIFMTGLGHPDHNLTTGLTYNIAQFNESFSDVQWNRLEQVTGLYAEYGFLHTFNKERGSAVGVMAGFRGDLFVMPGYTRFFPSPRVNFKYNINTNSIFRLSAGRGIRQPNALIENIRYMAGNRDFVLEEAILPEVAWNYGFNFTQTFNIGKREGSVNVDFYRTDFENQFIADADSDYTRLLFYNLRGKSFAHSFLVSYTQDLAKGLELRLSYKFNDVRTTYNDTLRLQPFSPQHRGLITLHYVTPNQKWQFNLTGQLVGPQRLPELMHHTADMPDYRHRAVSPTYFTGIFQVTHYMKKGWEMYLGVENISNYMQKAPIIGWQDPFSQDFDATAIYGPIQPAMIYLGFRYTLTPKKEEISAKKAHLYETVEMKSSVQCGTCERIIQEGFAKIKGVREVIVHLDTKIVEVQFEKKHLTAEEVKIALTKLGYDADELPSDPAAYNALPACCQKGGHD